MCTMLGVRCTRSFVGMVTTGYWPDLQLNSDISMRRYSKAGIAENRSEAPFI